MKRENEFRYIELAGILRTQILSGFIKPGEFLLSENDLCEKYEMSRTSVRKSLNELLNEGLIIKMAGKGTIVSPELTHTEAERQTLIIASPFPATYTSVALPLLIQMFESRYQGVRVRVLSIPLGNDIVLEDIKGLGVEVDLLIALDSSFSSLHLEDFCPLDGSMFVNKAIPAKLLEAFTYEQQVYSVPLTYSPIFLAYNPELFKAYGIEEPKPTWTLDDMAEVSKKLTQDVDGDGLIDYYGLALSNSVIRWLALGVKQGIRFNVDENGDYDTKPLEQFLHFIQSIVYREKVCPIYALNNQDFAQHIFDEGRAAMTLSTKLASPSPNSSFTPQIAHIPGAGNEGGLMIANGLMMNKLSPNPELAKLFLAFALEDEVQYRLAQETALLSIYNEVNNRIKSKAELEALQLLDNGIDRYQFVSDLIKDKQMSNAIANEMEMFWAGIEKSDIVVQKIKKIVIESNIE